MSEKTYSEDILAAVHNRSNKRMFVLVIILAVICFLQFVVLGGVLYYEATTVSVTTTQTVSQAEDGDSNNSFVGGDTYVSETNGSNNN